MEKNEHKLKLHAVIIKKPCELEEAKEEAKEYIKNPKNNFYRETKNSYRFRNIPKTKFEKKSFKTKKINKQVSLVFGILKPEFEHLEGAGFFDFFKKPVQTVKKLFSPREGYNNTTTKNLNNYGNLKVLRLTIARTPILNVLDKAINLISFGKWSQLKKEYSFDKLFHLQLIANLGNRNLVIEKNEVINVDTSYKNTRNTETLEIPLDGKDFNVNEMLEKTRQRVGDKLFFDYDGFTNNCQVFVKECLISENLYGENEKEFLFQDVSELAKRMPKYSKVIMNALTKTGAVANKLLGKGEKEMSLGEEFKMDTKDHEHKLTKYEKEKHNKKEIYETLQGLKEITNNSLKHIEILERMLDNNMKKGNKKNTSNKELENLLIDKLLYEYMQENEKIGAGGFFSKNPGESIVRGLFNLGKKTVEGVINANRISNERREKEKRDNEELNRRLKDVGDYSPFSGLPTKNPEL